MKHSTIRHSLLLGALAASLFVFGCQAEHAGDRCDEFFKNTCKAPLACVSMSDRKVCAGSCDTGFKCKDPAGCCETGFECETVSVEGPNGPLPAGKYCLKQMM